MSLTEMLYEIDARFALEPARSKIPGSCGSESPAEALITYLLSGDPRGISEVLSAFPRMGAFESTLAQITGGKRSPAEIAEAYWIGSPLLALPAGLAVSAVLQHNLILRYPPDRAQVMYQELTGKGKIILHHNFAVARLDWNASGVPKQDIAWINHCWVRGGQVEQVTPNSDSTVIHTSRLEATSTGGYRLVSRRETVHLDPELVSVTSGNYVAVHRGAVAMALTQNRFEQLMFWTREIVELL